MRLIVDDTTYEELAFSQLMESYSTGGLLFEKFKKYFEVNKVSSKNLIGIATDGAQSWIGKYRRLITYFK